MSRKYKIAIVGGKSSYANYLNGLIIDHEVVGEVDETTDIVLFCGGEDISPSIYGCNVNHPWTHVNVARDIREGEAFAMLDKYPNVLKVGVCRGAQFLCGISGGSIFQHVVGHIGNHNAIDIYGNEFEVSSTHHQMLDVTKMDSEDYDLIAWANNSTRIDRQMPIDYTKPEGFKDPEIVYFKKTNSLACQYHPEMMKKGSYGQVLFNELIISKIKKNEQDSMPF